MLLNFDDLVKKYNLNVTGVIQIGANLAQEHNIYLRHGIKNMMYFEPDPNTYNRMLEKLSIDKTSNIQTFNIALGNENKMVDFNVSDNDGASSSILEPKLHLLQHPNVHFTHKIQVEMKRFDDLNLDISNYNFANLDVQGYEYEVFEGMMKTLENNPHIKYIMSEINIAETYAGNKTLDKILELLGKVGFSMVEIDLAGTIWGDCLLLRNQ
jgi:FkbM family methyltransferase